MPTNFFREVRNFTEHPKIDVFSAQDTAKSIKD